MSPRPITLDDRSYDDLRSELIRRIPVHAPDWTDLNPGDPGIALLELFAYLGTNLLYRMNRVPEKSYAAFLDFLGLERRHAREATALVKLLPPPDRIQPLLVPFGGAEPATQASTASGIAFELTQEISVLPLEARAAVKIETETPEDDTIGASDIRDLLRDHLGLPETMPTDGSTIRLTAYETVELPAPEGGVEPPVAALERTLDGTLWIALLAGSTAFRRAADKPAHLAEIRRQIAGQPLSFGIRADETLCGPADHRRCGPTAGSSLLWEISTGDFRDPSAPRIDEIVYRPLSVIDDRTGGLARSGTVSLALPRLIEDGRPGFGSWGAAGLDPDLLGIGEAPPRLDDRDEARVVAWLRVRPRAPAAPPPRIRHIDLNMAELRQSVARGDELLGYGDGTPGQRFPLAAGPILPGSLRLQVRGREGWRDWQMVERFADSFADDPHCRLEEGEAVFGDGLKGRMPRPGEAIRALSYRVGGGAAGNVPAGAIAKVRGTGEVALLKASNPFAARNGADAESDVEAARRAPDALRHNNRAVAREDFARLVEEGFPGRVGRIEVLPRHMPHERVDGVPGVVTLVVVPAADARTPDTPTPDKRLLAAICAWLEPRRLVTTELYVTPPEYVRVFASAAFETEPGYGPETVTRWVELAVRQFLAPLPPYGPGGGGWDFGRTVRAGDIEAAVLRVEGVRLVRDIRLEGVEIDARGQSRDASGAVALRPWQLPHLANVQLTVGTAAEPIRRDLPSAPAIEGEAAIPVPIEREEC